MSKIIINDEYAVFPCGCEFPVLDKKSFRLDYDIEIENMNLDCPITWDLISDGNTKGVFQLETRFGQQYSKRLKPRNIEHLAALSALLRPGCTQSKHNNKSITDHYIDIKNGLEEVEYLHPSLEPILKPTYGQLVYQEQAMRIAQDIAGFDLQQADILRKAIGKKKADLMAKVKKEFLDGCKAKGIVDEKDAEEIFGWIEKSQRYSFNKSHAVSYAINGYMSAYSKAHFKYAFFTSYLYFAKDKAKQFDEIKLLVSNARTMNVDIRPPDFRNIHKNFKHIGNKIFFGFSDIKGIGESVINEINAAIFKTETALGKTKDELSWLEILIFLTPSIRSNAVEAMIEAGCLDYLNKSRQTMLFEYSNYNKLTKKEQPWIKQHINIKECDNLKDVIWKMLSWYNTEDKNVPKPCANKNRVEKIQSILQTLKHPPFSLEDSPDWIARTEEARLGISITASVLDSCRNREYANCTCSEFQQGKSTSDGIFIAAQIDSIKEIKTRHGENMAFISISDGDTEMDCVVFPDTWDQIRLLPCCIEENTVILNGERSQKDSFIVKKMWQLV